MHRPVHKFPRAWGRRRGRLVGSVTLGACLLAAAFARAETAPGLDERILAPRSGPRGSTLFLELPATQTGVVTTNDYADPAMWAGRYQEFQVGSIGTGVTIGDYDGDGRPDIFVVSKTESCRLFRNLGGFKFEDVTARAGVEDSGAAAKVWKQGATFADVNNDGRLDLYVCRFDAPNLLYVNQGDGTFKEMAAASGLAVKDASVMAAFCDYDRDGWLDVFVQTNLLSFSAGPRGRKDYLLHNRRDGTFENVSDKAGVQGEAQGHSATWWDYDDDGWPDLYVANDFAAPDKLYRNNRDGTFTDVIDRVVPHVPYSAMGSDLGDVNNDGLVDLFVPDMAATTAEQDQRGMADSRGRTPDEAQNPGHVPQYERNALYLNTGAGRCLEAAQLAGIAATDWTWSPRFEDLDNDGRLDLFVTNGMNREATNIDLLARQMGAETAQERVRLMKESPPLAEANLAFRNLGDLQFAEVGAAWGLNQRGVSFGSALADLDGDGDLDVVYGNYLKGATVLRNDSDTGHRVVIALHGRRSNAFGVGAVVKIETASGQQVRPLVLARGVLSSSQPVAHFGLGDDVAIRRLTVQWPSGAEQVFKDLAVDRRYEITEPTTPPTTEPARRPERATAQFREVSQEIGLAQASEEAVVDEAALQRLLPVRLNRRGPGLAIAPAGADGADEVVIGGTTRTPLTVLRGSADGRFLTAPIPGVGAGAINDGPVLVLATTENGGDDLLVTKGGSVLAAGAQEYQPQLFRRDVHGGYHAAAPDSLPPLANSVGAAAAADFDHDGRLDVFLGGRVAPGEYPLAPRSVLLANHGGRFEDVTEALAPGLGSVGLVTSALWSDADGDGWADLLLSVEWGTVRYFHNDQGRGFSDWTGRAGFAAAGAGWWTSLATADFNGDGRPDYVAGNVGLNTPYHADAARPALLFLGDFKGDGEQPQVIEARTEGDRILPWRSRRDLGAAIPSVLRRFPKNNAYARATLGEILGDDKLAEAQRFTATQLQSGVFLSQADGTWRFAALPRLAQIAPLQGIAAGDCDGDGFADIYAVQNSYAPIPAVGRYDGGLSQLLRGDGQGNFTAVSVAGSGLLVPGDAKALVVTDLDRDGWPDFLVSRNDATTLAFRNQPIAGRHSLRVRLRGKAGNPHAIGARVTLELRDGARQTSEVAAGSSYYSQSSPDCFFGWPDRNPPQTLRVRWPAGEVTTHEIPADASSVTLAEAAR